MNEKLQKLKDQPWFISTALFDYLQSLEDRLAALEATAAAGFVLSRPKESDRIYDKKAG